MLEHLGVLIRSLHEAAVTFEVADDGVWGGIPGAHTVAAAPVEGRAELVGQRDYCPGNVVFR